MKSEVKISILSRLDKLTPEGKALWGKMNVSQMLAHLNDAYRICLGMKPAKDRSTFVSRNIIFPAAVYILPGFPRDAPTAPEQNQHKGGTKPRDFYTELEFLKKMIDIFDEREEEKLKPHPLFGKLSKKQWEDVFVKHFDHHLKQFGV